MALLSGLGKLGGNGKISDGAVKVTALSKGMGRQFRHVLWSRKNEVIVLYNDAGKTLPQRINLLTGKATPLFPIMTPLLATVRGWPCRSSLSPNGHYLLWIVRDGTKKGNGIPHVVDLDTLLTDPIHPKILTWNRFRWLY